MKSPDILFENENFIAVHKLAGCLSVPSRDKNDPRPCVGIYLQSQLKNIFPCHRLDFETSGVLLFAKNKTSHKAANGWFEHHQIKKTYHALTEGPVANAQKFLIKKNIQSRLVRGKKRTFAAEHGQPAETIVQFLGPLLIQNISVLHWQLEPLTGRPHQLRFELSHLGFPILGDHLYGSQYSMGQPHTIALHALCLNFIGAPGAQQLGLPEQIELPFLPPTSLERHSP